MPRGAPIDRAAVVMVAAALADAAGSVEAVTLAAVAARLDIRIPSLYNYVDGLPGLRRELALLGIRELTTVVRDAAIGRAADDAILAIAHAYREFARTYPGRYVATLRPIDSADQEEAEARQVFVALLLQVLAAYQLHDDDALHVVRGLRSIVHGFVALELAGGFALPLDRDESFVRLVKVFLAGLHAA